MAENNKDKDNKVEDKKDEDAKNKVVNMAQAFWNIIMRQKSIIRICFMALITIGGEHIFATVYFNCPCSNDNFFYGMTFLLGPAALLLILGHFFSTRLWWIYTGCFQCKMHNTLRWGDCAVFVHASVVPIIWLTAALINGTFVECAATGLEKYCVSKTEDCLQELVKLPCNKSNSNSKEQLLMFRAGSQIIGWWLISLAAFIAVLVICFLNCCSQESYHQRAYKEHYAERLKKHFNEAAMEDASNLAKERLKRFFKTRCKESDHFTVKWRNISPDNADDIPPVAQDQSTDKQPQNVPADAQTQTQL